MEAGMPCGPVQHLGMFVGGIVVDDEMKLLACGAVDQPQKLEPLLISVAIHACGHHGAIERVRRAEWRGRALTLVVVGHGVGAAFFHGQPRSRRRACPSTGRGGLPHRHASCCPAAFSAVSSVASYSLNSSSFCSTASSSSTAPCCNCLIGNVSDSSSDSSTPRTGSSMPSHPPAALNICSTISLATRTAS